MSAPPSIRVPSGKSSSIESILPGQRMRAALRRGPSGADAAAGGARPGNRPLHSSRGDTPASLIVEASAPGARQLPTSLSQPERLFRLQGDQMDSYDPHAIEQK